MKVPKNTKRYCPFCKKHTAHKVAEAKKRTMGTAHPQSYGSKTRQKARGRGIGIGFGNRGRFSRPPATKQKMLGKKSTKKTDFRYTCQTCKKTHSQKGGFRAKKLEFV